MDFRAKTRSLHVSYILWKLIVNSKGSISFGKMLRNDPRQTLTGHKSSPCHYVTGELTRDPRGRANKRSQRDLGDHHRIDFLRLFFLAVTFNHVHLKLNSSENVVFQF